MFLIVGLGNPGEKYAATRHNAGFMFVEYICKHSEVVKPWKSDKYMDAEIAYITLPLSDNQQMEAIIAKPQTFMNKSGKAVNEILKKNAIPVENFIVIHDDLDMELGNFKIQKGTGPKVHNGLSSIEATLRRNDFARLRIGVDNRNQNFRIPGETYVLQNFTTEETKTLHDLFPAMYERFMLHIKHG